MHVPKYREWGAGLDVLQKMSGEGRLKSLLLHPAESGYELGNLVCNLTLGYAG